MADEPKDVTPDRPLPSTFYNIRSIVGAWIAGVSLIIITFLIVVELTGDGENPYTGILTFVVLPIFLILGLALIALGAIREHQRRQKDLPPSRQLPILDLNHRPHLRAVTWISFGSVLFLMMSAYGAFKAYEYTETNEFCGEVCHTVMHPEYTAYQDSPHARVHCVECHIGPGAEWFVKSKITGAYQVYAVLADVYPQPIPTPVHNLRPSRDTCEQCHWPVKFFEDKLSTRNYYLADEANTHMRLDLLLHIGGGASEDPEGIHWHTNESHAVEYVATDERRQEIPWVRLTRADGSQVVWVDEESDFDPATDLEGAEIRTMDCIDCHNRPSHRYGTPMDLVNGAMSEGRVDPNLPWMKSLAMEALDGEYETTEEAEEAIATRIRDEYGEDEEFYQANRDAIEKSISSLQEIYRHNFFPLMNANWKAYPENIGHLTAPGCFRCHDGMHVAQDADVDPISRDCTDCHAFLAQEVGEEQERIALAGIEYQHPEDIGGAWEFMDCTECHAP